MSETYTNVGLRVQLIDPLNTNLSDDEYDRLCDELSENNLCVGGKKQDIIYKAFIHCPIYEFDGFTYDKDTINDWTDTLEELLINLNINYAPGTIKLFFVNYYNGSDHPLVNEETIPLPPALKIKPFDMERHKKDTELEPLRKYWRISYIPIFIGPGLSEWVYKGTASELDKYLDENHSCNCDQCIGVSFGDQVASAEYFIEELKDDE